ncbi:MAG: efflux RND transporter periplasmic adaptor subunit [Campylobacterales bacterium]|nr:efflux RND transporter periplasmic adaptor subunit [Campylobacterales bacterium]
MKHVLLLCLLFAHAFAASVQTVPVTRTTQGATKTFYGTTTANEASVKTVTLRYDAYVEALHVNQTFLHVEKGDLLARVYSPEVTTAQAEYLHALRLNNPAMVESIAQKLTLLGLDAATIARLETRKTPFPTVDVFAPYAGIITQKNLTEGAFVPRGSPLYEITDYATLWLHANVYERDIPFALATQKVEVFFDMDPTPYNATLERVIPKLDPQTKSVPVRIVVKNPKGTLFENAFARIIFTTPARSYLALPSRAVITKGAQHFVFVKGDYEGEYDPRPIEAKRLNDGTFEVLSGLEEGEEVVAEALFMFDSDVQNFGGNAPW